MSLFFKRVFVTVVLLAVCAGSTSVYADAAGDLAKSSRNALAKLYKESPAAKKLGEVAKAVLVFPTITKGGFVIGAHYGKGTLLKGNKAAGFYNTAAASYGLQAGLQKFSYAMFFLSEEDLKYLDKSEGWEIGVGPSITVVDQGLANSMTTTTARDGVYVFFFGQQGLMAGLGIQGSKITRIDP